MIFSDQNTLAQRYKAASLEDLEVALLGCALLMLRIAFSCCVRVRMPKLATGDLDLGGVRIQHDLDSNLAHQVRMEVDADRAVDEALDISAERSSDHRLTTPPREQPR